LNRLTSSEQFRLAYREGQRASNNFFTVHARRNGLSRSRVGIAVSGRLGKSVDRNRIRRRIREVFRSLPDVPAGVDIIVVAKGPAKDVEFADLVQGAQDLIRRVAGDNTAR
jgi:ribonuclease P protein component